jgi:hypothetical protein
MHIENQNVFVLKTSEQEPQRESNSLALFQKYALIVAFL